MRTVHRLLLAGLYLLPFISGAQKIQADLQAGAELTWAGKQQSQQIPYSQERKGIFFQTRTGSAPHLQLTLKRPLIVKNDETIYAKAVFQTENDSPVSGVDLRLRDKDNEICAIRPSRFEKKDGIITAEWNVIPEPQKVTWGTSKERQNHFMDPPVRIYALGIGYHRKTDREFSLTLQSLQIRVATGNSAESTRPLWSFGNDFLPGQSGGYRLYRASNALIVNNIRNGKGWIQEPRKAELVCFREKPNAIELDAEAISGSVQAEWTLKDARNRTITPLPQTIQGSRRTYRFGLAGSAIQPPFRVVRLALQGTANQPGSLILHDSRILMRTSAAEALRFDVLTGTPLHVLKHDRAEAFHYQFTNTSQTEGTFRVTVTLTAYNGEKKSETFELAVKPGERIVRVPSIRPERNGHWTAVAEISRPGTQELSVQQVPFAKLIPAGPTPDRNKEFLFGICSHPERWSNRERELEYQAAALCGVKYLRATPGWGSVQPTPDQWNVDYLNSQLDISGAYGIELQGFLGFNPAWAVSPELRKKHWLIWSRSYPNATAFAAYAQRMAQEFRGRINYWELCNEPELSAAMNAEEFTKLQKLAFRSVKKGNPDAVMMSGGFAGSSTHQGMRDKQFMEKVLKNTPGFYEIHLTHNHGNFTSYAAAVENHLFPLRKRAGADRVPWFPNETGISSLFGTERNQAVTLYKKLIYSWSRGAIGYVWYDLRNDGYDSSNGEHNYGMLTTDFRPKPVYSVYNHLAGRFGKAHFAEQFSAPDGVWAFRFETPGEQLVPLWNESDLPALLALKSDAEQPVLSDFMDNGLPLPAQDGIVLVQAENEPKTLRFPNAAAVRFIGPLLRLEALDAAVPGREMKLKVQVRNPFPQPQEFRLSLSALPAGFQAEQRTLSVTIAPDRTESPEFRVKAPGKDRFPKQPVAFQLQCRTGSVETALRIPVNPAHLVRGLKTNEPDFILNHKEQVVSLTEADPRLAHRIWKGPDDLSARIYLGESNGELNIRVDVTDDVHSQPYSGFGVWKGDNLQLSFKFPSQGDNWELGASLLDSGKPELYLFHAPRSFDKAQTVNKMHLDAERKGNVTSYRIRIPLDACGWTLAMLRGGFRFNLLVNDNDGEGRDGWIQIAPGIGENKNPERYPFILFD